MGILNTLLVCSCCPSVHARRSSRRSKDRPSKQPSISYLRAADSVRRARRSVSFSTTDDSIVYANDGTEWQFRSTTPSMAAKEVDDEFQSSGPLSTLKKAGHRVASLLRGDGKEKVAKRGKPMAPNVLTELSRPRRSTKRIENKRNISRDGVEMADLLAVNPTPGVDSQPHVSEHHHVPLVSRKDVRMPIDGVWELEDILRQEQLDLQAQDGRSDKLLGWNEYTASYHSEYALESPKQGRNSPSGRNRSLKNFIMPVKMADEPYPVSENRRYAAEGHYLPVQSRSCARMPVDSVSEQDDVFGRSKQQQGNATTEERKMLSHLLKECGHMIRTMEPTICAPNCACLPDNWDHTAWGQHCHKVEPRPKYHHPCLRCIDKQLDRKYARIEAEFKRATQFSDEEPWRSCFPDCLPFWGRPNGHIATSGRSRSSSGDSWKNIRPSTGNFGSLREVERSCHDQLRIMRYIWNAQKVVERTLLMELQMYGNVGTEVSRQEWRKSCRYVGESRGNATGEFFHDGQRTVGKKMSTYRGVERTDDLVNIKLGRRAMYVY